MRKSFDVVVLGLGAHGSAALFNLSKTGYHVAGIDQFAPPHALGSSHGQSRIIRKAYHENPLYVPLVSEAYEYWHELEKISGKNLLLKTGGVILGRPDSAIVRGAKLSAETHQIPFEYLDSSSIHKRFPGLKPTTGIVGVVEKEAGILFPELCIQTFLEQAKLNGAELLINEKVKEIRVKDAEVEIITIENSYISKQLIISVGAWLNSLIPDISLPLAIERQVLFWLKDRRGEGLAHLLPDKLPIYIWEYLPGLVFYGFGDLGDGIKIALPHAGIPAEADTVLASATESEIAAVLALAREHLEIDPVFNYSASCKYTNTPDENFIIDFHPLHKNIVVASPCSGHGFKFASLVGKILSDMAIGQKLKQDISAFSLSRFPTVKKV